MNRDESYCSVKGCSQLPGQLLRSHYVPEQVRTNSALGTAGKVEMVLARPAFALRRGFLVQQKHRGVWFWGRKKKK